MYSTICVWYIDHHPCEASVHTNSVFIDKAVDDEQLQETWTSKTWKRCPMRGNSERFSSKNPVFDQRKGIVVASVIGIIASFRSYPCAFRVRVKMKLRYEHTRTDRAVKKWRDATKDDRRRKNNEREREKIALSLSLLISAFIRAFVFPSSASLKRASRKWRVVRLPFSFRFVSFRGKKAKHPKYKRCLKKIEENNTTESGAALLHSYHS